MCGICGQYNYLKDTPVIKDEIRLMNESIIHRGPDDSGEYYSGSVGLGFRRLSIIDIEGGHQPMSDIEKSVWVTFNGEIYNFPELRKQLEAHGHIFRTRSDTEVIIHGYKEWGNEILNHLNGMFGIAIWDEKKRKLILARDKMGIKLIYYAIKSGSLFWGSEIRPILASKKVRPNINPNAIYQFLRYRYIPSPNTILDGVNKLAPGTMLICEKGKIEVKRWWNFKPEPFNPMPSMKQAEEELYNLYQKAVKRQLISDVPLGLLLSGGVDSGLLLALMSQNGDNWKSYSIGFEDNFKNDEVSAAAETANIFGCPNISSKISQSVFEDNLSKIFNVLEEPVAASSFIPMYFICQQAREDVKVVLMGQGPDELFGGYKRHLGLVYGGLWRSIPNFARKSIKTILHKFPLNPAMQRALYSIEVKDRLKRYQNVFSLLEPLMLKNLFLDNILSEDIDSRLLDNWKDIFPLMQNTDELGGIQFLEIRSSLPDELLMYADKLSMAHSLEVRVPYLDEDIVKYAEKLSRSFKIKYGIRKRLHRQVCKKHLPKSIINRKKLGFQTPVDKWFRQSVNTKFSNTLLDKKSLIYNYLRPEIVKILVDDHKIGKSNNYRILFSFTVLEECLRNYSS